MQRLIAITAAISSSSSALKLNLIPPQYVIDQFNAETANEEPYMLPGSILPPDYVVMYFEADQLEAQGDLEGARLLREKAAAAKEAMQAEGSLNNDSVA